jgi:hypothetical protein
MFYNGTSTLVQTWQKGDGNFSIGVQQSGNGTVTGVITVRYAYNP